MIVSEIDYRLHANQTRHNMRSSSVRVIIGSMQFNPSYMETRHYPVDTHAHGGNHGRDVKTTGNTIIGYMHA